MVKGDKFEVISKEEEFSILGAGSSHGPDISQNKWESQECFSAVQCHEGPYVG